MAAIYEFYKKLFGKEERGSVRLDRSGGEGRILSYPVFTPKPITHRMYAQDQLFHTYGQKMLTYNQMSRIKYNY
jgi:hypothetical protein